MTPTYLSGPHKRAALFLSTFCCILLLGFGCFLSPGTDGDPDPDPEPTGDRSTPEKLLEEFLADAYNRQDSTVYDDMLDSQYEFNLLPDTVDATEDFWDRADELRIAGRMFSGWTNEKGIKVVTISLALAFQGKSISNDFFQDQPDGETWYKCITEVDLAVVTQDPAASDGSGIINRVVFSNQDFIVRPDPSDSQKWTVRRQTDKEAITSGKRATQL